jgi:rSAM-associated Gly-rich repeat protein
MANTSRRRFLKDLLGTLAGAAGSVVLASAAAPASAGEPAPGPQPETPDDIQERAEQLASTADTAEEEVSPCGFLNRGFRNAVGGGFRNGGFRNGGVGGGFRNGGFANGAGGGFRNGAFRNW